jgi:hypothetical protein
VLTIDLHSKHTLSLSNEPVEQVSHFKLLSTPEHVTQPVTLTAHASHVPDFM